jgi:hypothetical protein
VIKGKAKLEFGTGTICMRPCIREDGIGALFLCSSEPHNIGVLVPAGDDWKPENSEVVMTFTNPKSVKALITDLAWVYKYLLKYGCSGANSIPEDFWARKIELDFDAFLKE